MFRPKAIVKETKDGYELWFGKFVLTTNKDKKKLDYLADLFNK